MWAQTDEMIRERTHAVQDRRYLEKYQAEDRPRTLDVYYNVFLTHWILTKYCDFEYDCPL